MTESEPVIKNRSRLRSVPFLIAINVAVFVAWLYPNPTVASFILNNFLVSWSYLLDGRFWTLLTSVFSHNMFWHIFINMFVLFNFGPIVEDVLGTRNFLKFYLLAGIFSSLCHALVSAFILGEPDIPALGASGAISGLILIFSLLFPREKILVMGLIPVPAIFGAFAFIGLDVWGLIAQANGGGLPIGHGAHLGGALAGITYFVFYIRPRLKRRNQ
jgi:membrane associated rhomboid family serine protease